MTIKHTVFKFERHYPPCSKCKTNKSSDFTKNIEGKYNILCDKCKKDNYSPFTARFQEGVELSHNSFPDS